MSNEAEGTPRAKSEGENPEEEPSRSWGGALIREMRSHPFGYVVLALFVIAGPIAVTFLFPQAPTAVAIIGGLAFGAYAALCAVPQKFI
jgi:hypothetical protein